MELSKKSELTLGSTSYVINTELAGEGSQSIRTRVVGSDGSVAFETSQDISELRPIFQNSQRVFARMEAQHQTVIQEMKQGRLDETEAVPTATTGFGADAESDALEHAVSLLSQGSFEKATAALRAVLETYPNCSEARELLEVAYKASSGTRLSIDLGAALKRGTEAFAQGRQRDAIESWKQCLIEEPGNRLLQLLVMLATTWNPGRREHYAREVLAAGAASTNRPEEADALLLIAQTVEGATLISPPPATDASADDSAGLESLVPDASDTLVVTGDAASVPPAPSFEEPSFEEPTFEAPTPDAFPPPMPDEPPPLDEPETAASLVGPEPVSSAPTLSPELDDTVVPAPPAQAPSPQAPPPAPQAPPPPANAPERAREPNPPATPPAPDAATATREVPTADPGAATREAPAAPAPRPVARRPMGRAKRRSAPWPWIGGAIAAVLVVGVVLFFLLSGGGSVPQARLEQAANFVGSGQYAQAISAYDALIAEYGDHADIYLGRGRAKVASGDTEGGLGDLRRARDLDPEAPSIAEEIGDVYYSSGNYPEAIEHYQRAFASGPGSAESRYRLAASYVQRDQGDAALEHLKAAITADPQHGEAQFLYGDLLNERARFAEAEKALRAAEPYVDGGSDYLAELSVSLLGQGKLDQAEETARTFLRNYPSDARGHSVLGEVYLSRRQYEQARAELIRALRIDRNEPRAQIALGRTWLAIAKSRGDQGDLAKARQVLSSATGAHEGQRLLALGQVALAEGDLEQAERLLRESLEHGAAALAVHLALAESKARGEDLVGAAEEMQRAAGFAPDDPAISLSLAIFYSQLQEADRASEHFLKTIQGIGMVTPPGPDAGPVMLPAPYVPIPNRFDVNRAIRSAYTQVLQNRENDPSATELQKLAESTTFVLGTG